MKENGKAKKRVDFRLPKKVVEAIDEARGKTSRSEWVRESVEFWLASRELLPRVRLPHKGSLEPHDLIRNEKTGKLEHPKVRIFLELDTVAALRARAKAQQPDKAVPRIPRYIHGACVWRIERLAALSRSASAERMLQDQVPQW